ncbi:protein of unknown function [Methanoculleus bourgensis]|uniref:Carbohydrate kinase PfkB domain-containing protein n=1 Tax=Methanoculleus bourgensis TaxID=83986 RepID=A0A0X3BJT5_9EURY|nr:protein of unknown function [Methanoculleus bourgensis]
MISVVGHTAIDHLFRVPDLPGRHNSTYIMDHKVYFGGGAANIAAGIATLGEKCQLISSVGGDFPGSDYDRWLRDLGVEQDFAVVEGARTATAYVFTDDAGDQETFFEWGASTAFASAEAPALTSSIWRRPTRISTSGWPRRAHSPPLTRARTSSATPRTSSRSSREHRHPLLKQPRDGPDVRYARAGARSAHRVGSHGGHDPGG